MRTAPDLAAPVLDPGLCALRRGSVRVDLTPREFVLLDLLARRPGVIRTRGEILDHFGHGRDDIYDRTIDGFIKRIRAKMRAAFGTAAWLQTRHGFGYLWCVDPGKVGAATQHHNKT